MENYTLEELNSKETLDKAAEEFSEICISDDSGSTNFGHFDLDTFIVEASQEDLVITRNEMDLLSSI